MRQIKFRGKRLNSGEWFYGDLVHDNSDCYIFNPEAVDSYDNYKVDPSTVGQFTGLTDKNGTEIYEGDILSTGKPQVIYTVEWVVSGLSAKVNNDCHHVGLGRRRERMFIIGNIHDNPELMNDGKQ